MALGIGSGNTGHDIFPEKNIYFSQSLAGDTWTRKWQGKNFVWEEKTHCAMNTSMMKIHDFLFSYVDKLQWKMIKNIIIVDRGGKIF